MPVNLKSEGKGQYAGQVALLKLGLVANLTSLPWKQPVRQLVPVNLRPGGASAPDRLQERASQLTQRRGTQEPC